MKGLLHIPSLRELAEVYAALQTARTPLPPAKLALWSQWARLDPRLAEQLVAHLSRHWQELNPLALHDEIRAQPWPAALGVLLEQAAEAAGPPKVQLRRWSGIVMNRIARAPDEQFFIGLRAFGGKLMLEDARLSHASYRRWGFLSREVLLNKALTGNRTRLPAQARAGILNELIQGRTRLTVREYREALGNQVSPRVAEMDLLAHPRLLPRSRTRGRFYLVRKA